MIMLLADILENTIFCLAGFDSKSSENRINSGFMRNSAVDRNRTYVRFELLSGRSEVRILLATGFRRAECISQLIDSALSFFYRRDERG
jgi:hypothetical protein